MNTEAFTEAARAEVERWWPGKPGPTIVALGEHMAEWARDRLAAQEESILMTLREETISDRFSDAGYTEYAEDEDGGVTWVSAPLGEVLRIVSAAQEPTDAEVEAARKATDDHLIVTEHYRDGEIRWQGCKTCDVEIRGYAEQERHELRAALSAARAARRDEEKR